MDLQNKSHGRIHPTERLPLCSPAAGERTTAPGEARLEAERPAAGRGADPARSPRRCPAVPAAPRRLPPSPVRAARLRPRLPLRPAPPRRRQQSPAPRRPPARPPQPRRPVAGGRRGRRSRAAPPARLAVTYPRAAMLGADRHRSARPAPQGERAAADRHPPLLQLPPFPSPPTPEGPDPWSLTLPQNRLLSVKWSQW